MLLNIRQCLGQPLQPGMPQPQMPAGLKLGNAHVEISFIKPGSDNCVIHLLYFPMFPLKAVIQMQDCVAAPDPGTSFPGFNNIEREPFRRLSCRTPEFGSGTRVAVRDINLSPMVHGLLSFISFPQIQVFFFLSVLLLAGIQPIVVWVGRGMLSHLFMLFITSWLEYHPSLFTSRSACLLFINYM